MSRRRLIIPIALLIALLSFAPSMAAWGAGWGSGSVIGNSFGSVPYANGTSVSGMVAPPACKIDSNDNNGPDGDGDADDCGIPRASMRVGVLNTTAAQDPTVLTGAVFCQRTHRSDDVRITAGKPASRDGEDNQVSRGVKLATIKIIIPSSATVQDSKFSIHLSVPQSALDALDAKSLCANPDRDTINPTWRNAPTWKIIDFVPKDFFAVLRVGPETRTFSCKMKHDNFEDLHWDRRSGRPSFEPYQC